MRVEQERPQRTRTEFSTTPTVRPPYEDDPSAGRGWAVAMTVGALGVFGVLLIPTFGPGTTLDAPSIGTVLVFVAAVACWISGKLDDTFVAITAAGLLTLFGVLEADELFGTLGAEPIWLLLAAFVLAEGINQTGLPSRIAVHMAGRARSPRQLVHLVTAALVCSALIVPSTSGRAALALPVFTALASAFSQRKRLVKAMAILFPTIVLLSAIASLVGAGAHLVTTQILAETTDIEIGFTQWLLCGVPLAIVSSHLAAEIVLLLFTRGPDRGTRLELDSAAMREHAGVPRAIRPEEWRAAGLLAVVIALWSTEPWHGLPPALIALGGALAVTAPRFGQLQFGAALKAVPWSLLLFMAATTALGTALTSSGVAQWIAGRLLNPSGLLVSVILLSLASHLLVQSRTARSSVLIPLVIPAAVAAGANPAALAFASTAAAGFCHTLPSSAKPVAMFANVRDLPTYTARDLLLLSTVLGPVMAGLILLFAVAVWPSLGLPLY